MLLLQGCSSLQKSISRDVASDVSAPSSLPSQEDFKLREEYLGRSFFHLFEFKEMPEPTHGFVRYVNQAESMRLKLTSINERGNFVMRVDDQDTSANPRASVRLHSKAIYNSGLIILDFEHMPEGPGTWPAFWSHGPDWPNAGEFDIIEQMNDSPVNYITLHSNAGCKMTEISERKSTGKYIYSRDCNEGGGQIGCSVEAPRGSFGPLVNRGGGGVYATLWTKEYVQVWFFARKDTPADILQNRPDPRRWGKPTAYFELGEACPAKHYFDHNLILNTTLCGDWAGPAFNGPTGIGTEACDEYIRKNPRRLKSAYWEIRSIRTYDVN